jgi:hypothetical protein
VAIGGEAGAGPSPTGDLAVAAVSCSEFPEMGCDPVIEAARLAAEEMLDRVCRGIDLSMPDCFEIPEYSACLGVGNAAGYHSLVGHLGGYVD